MQGITQFQCRKPIDFVLEEIKIADLLGDFSNTNICCDPDNIRAAKELLEFPQIRRG